MSLKISSRYILLSVFLICMQMLYTNGLFSAENPSIFTLKHVGTNIYEGVFTGNGLLGTMTYLKDRHHARIDIGRTDVYDHRETNEDVLFDKARLPIGHFSLAFSDSIDNTYGEINYHHAEAIAYYQHSKQNTAIKTLTFSQSNIIYIEISKGKGTLPELIWNPEIAQSPRLNFSYTQKPIHYLPNPQGQFMEREGVKVYVQTLNAGGGYAVAFKKVAGNEKDCYFVTITYAQEGEGFVDQAVAQIKGVGLDMVPNLTRQHQEWWERYNLRSSLRVPDKQLQQFYAMQRYKLACATRSDKPAIDLQGPWTSNTPWPAYWHNLNMQLTYSPTFVSNNLDIARSLIAMIDRNKENLILNVPKNYRYNSAAIGRSSGPDMLRPVYLEKGVDIDARGDGDKELGNLTWMLHSYYQYYRYSMDSSAYNRLFPLLKMAVNYYLHLLENDNSGKYHIAVKTFSPEYPKGYGFDTNYDLSILKWGLKTLISLDNERDGSDPLHTKWEDILKNLRDYPKNDTGFLIAKDIPYSQSHRHYSHLLMIYPFYDVNWDNIEQRDLIKRSIAHWQSKTSYLQGYSFSGAASMYAMMGLGNKALESLKVLLTKYVKPNTLYAESGPVIETPLAAMQSINELMLQHWNGFTRVFPAIPDSWEDVSFKHFLTDRAFLISATREQGKTKEIIIESQYDGTIQLMHDMDNPKVKIKGNGKLLKNQHGESILYLEDGAKAIFY